MNKVKRVAALIGIILIASMYLISLISAFFATKAAPGLFLASVFCTLVIPILIYVFLLFYRLLHKNEASMNITEDESSDSTDDNENTDMSDTDDNAEDQ